MELRLSDADRARYGGPEWLPWDQGGRLTVDEATHLQELVGVGYGAYRKWLNSGVPAVIQWALWLSLRRVGVDASWDDLADLDLLGVGYRDTPEPEGKDPGSTPPSPSDSDDSSTPQP